MYETQQDRFEQRELNRLGPDDPYDFVVAEVPWRPAKPQPVPATKSQGEAKHYAGDDRDQT